MNITTIRDVPMRSDKTQQLVPISIDQVLAVLLLPVILPLLALLYIIVVPLQGRPFLFTAERMRGPNEGFVQFKIRTMQPVDRLCEQSVMGGDLAHRVTPIGAFLRKTRLDELPQILNVIRGEMVFIGPRPPLRKYVEANPKYAQALEHGLPGITGLATVLLHTREERLLSACKNAAETDRIYREQCIPLKIRLDELYNRNKSLKLKMFILWRTVSRLAVGQASLGFIKTMARNQPSAKSAGHTFDQLSRSARLK